MAYKLSKARKAFESEADSLILTLQTSKKDKILSQNFRSHIICSCVMLCMAQLEIYVEDVVLNWIKEINRTTVQSSALPKHLRAFFFQGIISNAFKRFIFTDSESEFLKAVSESFNSSIYQLAVDSSTMPRLSPNQLLQNKYPSPKNLKKYFSRIGIPSIFSEMNKLARRDTELVLESFNDIRTAVAHDGTIPGASTKDIINQLKGIKRFVATLDIVVHNHIISFSPASCWLTH